jgi:hypothetical protein
MKLKGTTDGVMVVASIDRHDCVDIGQIMHDGGQPGTQQYSGYNRGRGRSIYFEVPQTFGELYTDYQTKFKKDDIRSYGIWNTKDVKVLDDIELGEINTFEYEVSQAIWGTCGVNQDDPLKYIHLVDCSTKHLRAIQDTQALTDNYKKIIAHILKFRAIEILQNLNYYKI